MSRSTGLSFNFTDGFSPHPPDFSNVENDTSGSRFPTIALSLVAVLVVAIAFYLYAPPLYHVIFRCNRQDQDQDQAQEQETAAPLPDVATGKKEQKTMRYAEVESWLMSRRIEPHDDICEKALLYLDSGADNPKVLKHGTSSVDMVCTDVECGSFSADEETECPVCMEALKVGELVSWSSNTHCEHVFHHGCIKEWLLKRECCPCCRQIFLPVNQLEGLTNSKRIEKLRLVQQQRAANIFFCIRHGAVTLSEPELCFTNRCELEKVFNKVHREPSPSELAAIRGFRNDGSYEVDGCIPVGMDVSESEEISPPLTCCSIDEELAEPQTSSESTDDSLVIETPCEPTDEIQSP
jgi:hypothetical protein